MRNRKSQSAAVRFGPALKAVMLCLLIGGSGVGYVWQKEQISKLGQEKKRREIRLNALEEHNEQLRKQLSDMRSVRFLEQKIKTANLGLAPMKPSQMMWLPEPVPEKPRPVVDMRYAASAESAGTP